MFWSKDKNKPDKQKGAVAKKALQGNSGESPEHGKSQRIRQEALANARQARAEIGAEALDQIAALMTKKQQSIIEQTRAKVAQTDAERVAQEILLMLDER